MKIWFDMDGTIADLYGVKNWLERLNAHDATPYIEACPLCSMNALAKLLNALHKRGHYIGIISWCSADNNRDYYHAVAKAKYDWLRAHLPSVCFDALLFVPYGTDKAQATGGGVLFDDNDAIREGWGADAYEPSEIFAVLRELL